MEAGFILLGMETGKAILCPRDSQTGHWLLLFPLCCCDKNKNKQTNKDLCQMKKQKEPFKARLTSLISALGD